MTTFWSAGFETNDFSEFDSITGSPTVASDQKYAGTYSMKINNMDIFYTYGAWKDLTGILPTTYYIHARIRVNSFDPHNDTDMVIFLGPSDGYGWNAYNGIYIAARRLSGVIKLGIWDHTNLIFYDSGLTLTFDYWYDIDMKIVVRASTGSAKLYIDNVLKVTVSNIDTTSEDGIFAGASGNEGGFGQGNITCWLDVISIDENAGLNPIGHYGGKITIGTNGATSLESPYVLDVSMEQSCDVALRDVPLKSLGEVMDTGTYMVHTLTLAFSMRLSDADKTTLETLFTSHAEATVYLEDEYGDYWTFTGWFRDKDVIYEYERTRPWKVNFIFDIYTYSYSGASIGTFTNSQLRLVGGTTLDFEDIIDFSVSEESSVAIPKWVNQSPTIDTNVWNKKLKRVTYTVRETEYRLYKLFQMLTAHTAITFYDYIHGPTNKTAWLTSVRADWNPVKKENLGSFVNAPWEVEFEVIVRN